MLISALCDYYDELAKNGKMVADGFSKQNVHFLIALTPEGRIAAITPYRRKSTYTDKKGIEKERLEPRTVIMPKRTEKPGIESNIIEHRPLYIFGLNYDKKENVFTPLDKTGKAKKSHNAFVKANLEFIEGMDTPLINAYRCFIQSWEPEKETENPALLSIVKEYSGSYFVFCLIGYPDRLLHDEKLIKDKFISATGLEEQNDVHSAQCAVTGRTQSIARIHNKIKGVVGGQPSGTVLVGFKTSAGCSYGNEQSYNSNISEEAMKKYSEAFNYLLSEKRHRTVIDDTTMIYWAASGDTDENCCSLFDAFFNGTDTQSNDEKMDKAQTDQMLSDTFSLAKEGRLTKERLSDLTGIDDSVDFYIAGLKPNSSRLALKFIYRRRFADILFSIAKHQEDTYIVGSSGPVPMWRLKKELLSPNGNNQAIDPALLSALFRAIIYDVPYPDYMLSTLVTRAKTDRAVNRIRAGAIKACLNRRSRASNKKEESTVALDISNTNQAYLCGRLFAVLEKIQEQAAAPAKLNRTIKDAYFASAASKPSLVFPKLLSLSQNHQKKLDDGKRVYYNKMIEEIASKLEGAFPDTLLLTDQGRFMIGYYHQAQDFFTKKTKEEN